MPFSGTITALITPFKEGNLDEEGLRKNLSFQIREGINALLVLGTTGEGATLSADEQKRVIEIANEEKKVPIIVNAGDLSTTRTIERVKEAEKIGADGLLIIAPYYNCPSQEGLALHFEAVAQETSLPIILYNHPRRVGIEFSLELLIRLSKQKNIVGIKDSSGSIAYAAKIRNALPELFLFAGDDLMSLPLLAIGASGLISVLSNLIPHVVKEMVSSRDQKLYNTLLPLMEATQLETNPAPIKAMMELVNLPSGTPRLPLTCLTSKNYDAIKHLLLKTPLIHEVALG